MENVKAVAVTEQSIEVVERKGRGHPDYIADGTAENACKELCDYYNEKFGSILHHNLDKGLVVGGRSNPVFGGGKVLTPIYIVVAGRAVTFATKGNEAIEVPAEQIANRAIKDFLRKNFRFLNVDKDVVVDSKVRQGSVDLVRIFEEKKSIPLANDTSFGVAYAPLSPTENLTLEMEKFLNSAKFKKELPEVGEDIKVMAFRKGKDTRLTISAAFISSLVHDKDHYESVRREVQKKVEDYGARLVDENLEIFVNTGDNPKRGAYYLTVTGTSAEMGDDGNTGRGNRIHGLITPGRPMSLEASAGKNPVSHVGKIYNVLAKLTANRVVREVKGVEEVYIKILSQIGKPINEPQVAHVQLIPKKGYTLGNISADVKSIVDEDIANISRVTDVILKGEVELF